MASRDAPLASGGEPSARKDLTSWWRQFKKGGSQRKEEEKVENQAPQGIFGVPLQTSVRYANVAISLTDADGNSYIYGYVPIVVAKCGVFLKEKATDVEGIFRLSGSEKRIKELKLAFNSPDRYGKGLDWTGYTVHDAANILRRYFNNLPEPIVPLDFYDRFRDPIRNHQSQAVGPMDGQSPSVGDFNMEATITLYQQLITELPPLNRQLLLYILDLLAVFASKCELNKMTTPNLAAIFQPGILSHPAHDMAPSEYRLSQDVLIFLIENQDHFLIGMPGTAADVRTVQEVESGPPTPQNRSSTPRHSKSTVVRSGSNSSRYSGIRRSASMSSRRSRNSVAASPLGTEFHTPLGSPSASGAVHRSNTLPPSRSPNLVHGRFGLENHSGKSTPDRETTIKEESRAQPKPEEVRSGPNTEKKRPAQGIMHEMMTPTDSQAMPPPLSQLEPPANETTTEKSRSSGIVRPQAEGLAVATNSLIPPPGQETPTSASKAFNALFTKSPTPNDSRKPNKLQKKPKSGSRNPSAQSSTNDLNGPSGPAHDDAYFPPTSPPIQLVSNATGERAVLPRPNEPPLESPPPIGAAFNPGMSPSVSVQSQSDYEHMETPDNFALQGDSAEGATVDAEKRRRHWFSRKNDGGSSGTQGDRAVGSNDPAARSRNSVLSGGDARKSVTLDRSKLSSEGGPASTTVTSDSEKDSKKNPIHWIKGRLQKQAEKREERKEEKRLASPTRAEHQSASMNSLTQPGPPPGATLQSQPSTEQPQQQSRLGRSIDIVRGRSMEVPRTQAAQPSPHRPSHDTPRSLSATHHPPPSSQQAGAQGPGTAPVTIPE